MAIKKSVLGDFSERICQTGLKPMGITSTPLAMQNFHLVNGLDDFMAAVNLGAAYAEIVISKPGAQRMGFIRSISLGGQLMDKRIAEVVGLEAKGPDPHTLKEQGVAISPNTYPGFDAHKFSRIASEAATEVAFKIVQEIRRSLDYYISQPYGVAIDNIVLSGGLAKITNLAEYLTETLGIETAGPKINPSLNLPAGLDNYEEYATAIGLALQGVEAAPITLNVL
jgi:Tfp pilus assembly PilM family ATPase